MPKKQKVAIITYSRAYNYGSVLQAFALNRFLNKNGYVARTIDYTTKNQQKLYRIFEPWRGLLPIARNIHSLFNYRKLLTHKKRFDEFIDLNIPTTERIENTQQMDGLNKTFDYFICGSDQIWNVDCDDFDANYMLDFVQDKSTCIAYAPSLGAGANKKTTFEAISRYATCFKAISSREVSSAEIINRATSHDVTTVCDPVFLLSSEDWSEISVPGLVGKDYILGYFIGDVAGLRDFAAQTSKAMKLPLVVIYKNIRDLKYPFTNRYDSGPTEFVSLVKDAKMVVTNSFHAVSFSLIFKKDFWVFVNNAGTDTRISGILETAGFTDRILTCDTMSKVAPQHGVNYDNRDLSALDLVIEHSKQFLFSNLS